LSGATRRYLAGAMPQAALFPAGSDCLTHMAPERRFGPLEPRHKAVVGPGDELSDVEAGKVRV
jgi:hypothetical protein